MPSSDLPLATALRRVASKPRVHPHSLQADLGVPRSPRSPIPADPRSPIPGGVGPRPHFPPLAPGTARPAPTSLPGTGFPAPPGESHQEASFRPVPRSPPPSPPPETQVPAQGAPGGPPSPGRGTRVRAAARPTLPVPSGLAHGRPYRSSGHPVLLLLWRGARGQRPPVRPQRLHAWAQAAGRGACRGGQGAQHLPSAPRLGNAPPSLRRDPVARLGVQSSPASARNPPEPSASAPATGSQRSRGGSESLRGPLASTLVPRGWAHGVSATARRGRPASSTARAPPRAAPAATPPLLSISLPRAAVGRRISDLIGAPGLQPRLFPLGRGRPGDQRPGFHGNQGLGPGF